MKIKIYHWYGTDNELFPEWAPDNAVIDLDMDMIKQLVDLKINFMVLSRNEELEQLETVLALSICGFGPTG